MLFNLSLRIKLPLLGAALILATALALSASFLYQTWEGVRRDTFKNLNDLGQTMSKALFPALLHDDVWRAYETVSLPFKDSASAQADALIVLDTQRRVFASSHPDRHPVLSELAALGGDFPGLDRELAAHPEDQVLTVERDGASHLFFVIPIENDTIRLGSLIVSYDNAWIRQRFVDFIERAAWITALILAVLLPISWYWGRRMVAPLQLVTERLSQISAEDPAPLDPKLYPYTDEVGVLYRAYAQLSEEMKEKLALKREVIKNERMAAVGRLTASIAHEINNPLGGLLNAVSTLKRYGSSDPLNQKTISLLERGLSQIKETVAALLVEAKMSSRGLTPQDLDDVRLLVSPGANAQSTRLSWASTLTAPLPLPSTPLRQVLINLTLNAIQAAGHGGRVAVRIDANDHELQILVENDGQGLSPALRERLFEPFAQVSEHGNGLGLWVCYQIVTQLNGTIRAESEDGLTRFCATLPLSHSDEH